MRNLHPKRLMRLLLPLCLAVALLFGLPGTALAAVSTITIIGVVPPAVGATPSDAFTIVSDDVAASGSDPLVWYDVSSNSVHTGPFAAAKYEVRIYVVAQAGESFDPSVTATINGGPAVFVSDGTVYYVYQSYDLGPNPVPDPSASPAPYQRDYDFSYLQTPSPTPAPDIPITGDSGDGTGPLLAGAAVAGAALLWAKKRASK